MRRTIGSNTVNVLVGWLAPIPLKPKLMRECHEYMAGRYDFHGTPIDRVFMSGHSKLVMAGPVARYQGFATLSPRWPLSHAA